MKPVNNKSLTAFLFAQMEKLDNDEIGTDKALAQAKIASQINSQMRYELERSRTIMEVARFQIDTGKTIPVREIESKNF